MQIDSIRNGILNSPRLPSTSRTPPEYLPETDTSRDTSDKGAADNIEEISKVISQARKILCFSPISPVDIKSIMNQNPSLLENEAYIIAIQDFLHLEMKIPVDLINNLKICRVFPPISKPTDFTSLYAEFTNTSNADLILNFARYLQPGKQVNINVPARLQPRFAAVNSLAFEYRKGPTKEYKTRVKYGLSDFVLLTKPRHGSHPWSYASLASLPPLRLAPVMSPSPAVGRPRYQNKRTRSNEEESRSNRPRFNQVDSIEDEDSELNNPANSYSSDNPTALNLTTQKTMIPDKAQDVVPAQDALLPNQLPTAQDLLVIQNENSLNS